MAEIERMTITLPSDMAAVVRAAVDGGDYASSSSRVGPDSGKCLNGSKIASIAATKRVAICADASVARVAQISARSSCAASVRRSVSGWLIASSRAR